MKDMNPKTLSALEKYPELLFQSFPEVETEIIKILVYADSGLKANDIYLKIISGTLKEYSKTSDKSKLEVNKPSDKNEKEWLKMARKFGKLPSHNTLIRHLNNLFEQGVLARKIYPEDKRISYLYFIHPKIRERVVAKAIVKAI